MKKILFVVITFLGLCKAKAQVSTNIPLDMAMYLNKNSNIYKEPDVEGNPFLINEYKPAFIKLKNGQLFKNIPVKLNMFMNELWFIQQGSEYILPKIDSVSLFEFPDDSLNLKIFKSGYPIVNSKNENSIYQLLVNGKIQLLKYYNCNINEVRNSSFAQIKKFETLVEYYIYYNGEIKKVKANKKSLKDALPVFKNEIESFHSVNNETSLLILIENLNSL